MPRTLAIFFAKLVLMGMFWSLVGCGETAQDRKAIVAHLRELKARIQKDNSDIAALDEIVQVMNGDWSFARTHACATLGDLEALARPAVPSLVEALNSSEGYVERQAAISLGKIGPAASEAVPALILKLRDGKGHPAVFSARALGRIGVRSDEVLSALGEACKSPNPLIAEAANDALEELNNDADRENSSSSQLLEAAYEMPIAFNSGFSASLIR